MPTPRPSSSKSPLIPLLAIAGLIAGCVTAGEERTASPAPAAEERQRAIHLPEVEPPHPAAGTDRSVLHLPADLGDRYPFSLRFGSEAQATAENRIELEALRFSTDPLVTKGADGARIFLPPDLSTFPPQLTGNPFRARDRDYFIVQSRSPEAQLRLRAELERIGGRLLEYIPERSYLVELDVDQHATLSRSADVFWIGFYQPAFRIDPKLDYIIFADAERQLQMELLIDRGAVRNRADVSARLRAAGVREVTLVERRREWLARVEGAAIRARSLVVTDGVLWVERYAEPSLHDNVARTSSSTVTGRGATNGPIMDVEDVWARGIRGEGQIAAGADTGLSTGDLATLHKDYGEQGSLTNPMRVLKGYALGRATWDDDQSAGGGHGTHTSGSIVGNGFRSGSDPSTNYFPSTSYAGTAPKAQFVFQAIMDSSGGLGGIPADLNTLFQAPYNDGARVHSNSWGAAVAGDYNANSKELDQFAWRNKDMVITFSAGNSGFDGKQYTSSCGAGTPDGVIDPDTIGAPGTAKNCITVGASENYRPDFVYEYPENDCTVSDSFGQQAWGWFSSCEYSVAPIYADKMADNANGMGAFSSRGPADDSRFKPEVVAPGIAIISTRTDKNQAYEQWGICNVPLSLRPYYLTQGGTSMSNPLVAGTAVLVRQYYVDGWHPNNSLTTHSSAVSADGFNPSAALVKATLIHGAWNMAPGQYGTGSTKEIPPGWDTAATVPNNAAGFGRVDLEKSLFPGSGWGDHAGRKMAVHDVTPGLQTGGSATYTFEVGGNENPLIVTLVWTDPPASETASVTLINNLDLTVTAPDGTTVYYPNGVDKTSGADSRNNVEQVKVSLPGSGTWTIRVNGTSVPGNAESGSTTQPYAVVISGVTCTPPSTPSGLAVTSNSDNAIGLGWNSVSGASLYRILRSTTGGGGYTSIGTTTGTTFTDMTVSGGITYYYVVRAETDSGCESPNSTEVSATASGLCNLAPTFDGLASVSAPLESTCKLSLSWTAATSPCGGNITYSVYRSTTSGFTPDPANRIATGVADISYTDIADLVSGTTYYYIVRAATDANGQEETNTVQRSATPTGPVAFQTLYFDDFDGNRPANAAAYWIARTPASDDNATHELALSSCLAASPTTAYRFGPGNSCTGEYTNSEDNELIVGGDGSTSGINGFAIPAGSTSVKLRFKHAYEMEANYDGARLYYSTTSATSGYAQVPDTSSATVPYIESGAYTGTISSGTIEVWNGAALSSFTDVVVNLDAVVGTTVWFLWRFTTDGSVVDRGYYLDDVKIDGNFPVSCSSVTGPAAQLTLRSSSNPAAASPNGTNKLEWSAPANSSVEIRWSTTAAPTATTEGTLLTTATTDSTGYGSYTHTGLTLGTRYYYSAWVVTGSSYSTRRSVSGTPADASGSIKWQYQTGAATLTPPALNGGVFSGSNDRFFHAVNLTSSGGDWPRTSPKQWKPLSMNAPSQARSPVLDVSSYPIGGANRVSFVSSQDGRVYCVNADTGALLWSTGVLGEMIQASASGIFRQYGGALAKDLLIVGTRNSISANKLIALDAADGSTEWEFDNGASTDSTKMIGVISGAAMIDTANNRVWFASRRRSGGSSNSVWAVDFTATTATLRWAADAGDIDGSPIKRNDVIYAGNNSGTIYAYQASATGTPAPLWTYATSNGAVKAMVLPEWGSAYLFFSTTDRVWALTDGGSSASLVWATPASGTGSIPSPTRPLKQGEKIFVGSSDGNVHVLTNIRTASPSVSTLAISSGTVIGSPVMDYQNNLLHVGTEAGVVYGVQP